ncbi:MAG: PPC domain-containing protein [Planctomycetota bacterium]|jgi:hypothetical protein
MTKLALPLSLVLSLYFAASAPGQSKQREPEIGYLYPAGAQQGSVVRLIVGGQNLRNLKDVRISGEGVNAWVVRYMGRIVRLNGEERRALRDRLIDAKIALGAGPTKEEMEKIERWKKAAEARAKRAAAAKKAAGEKPDAKKDPEAGLRKITRHPLLGKLDKLTLEELEFVERKFLKVDYREQPNAQIAETAMIEVFVDPDARPGNRELRLLTGLGLTNALCFQVGPLPEVREPAPADPRAGDTEPIELPVVLNGQITPGDVDRFCVRAEKGQKLVIRAHARRLVPFLADAVPGWFQAVLTLRDGQGREVAYADDFRFDPDPVLFYEIPETGIYKVEIHDSIYRGRDDFVYRIALSQGPFIKSVFPLGGRSGTETTAVLEGWNLNGTKLPLDTRPGPHSIRFTALDRDDEVSNPVAYAVDELPEILEAEPNDAPEKAEAIDLPSTVNGRIAKAGDRDWFRFKGRAGDKVVAEVIARKLRSPLDSLLRLTDPTGKVLAWNDDTVYKQGHLHRAMGVLTHHSDSYLRATLPEDGVYCVEVTDAQGRGGVAFGYRLRLGPPRADFALRVTPSGLNAPPGRATVIHVHALRKDGFDGEIEVRLKNAPQGFALQGGVIPAGVDHIRMTLKAPNQRMTKPVHLALEGLARIGDREVRREVVPADDVMQAFLWRHLVPAQELIVAVVGRGARGSLVRIGLDSVQIHPGGSARVRFRFPRIPIKEKVELELSEPPKGLTLTDAKFLPGTVEFTLRADAKTAVVGLADNLIVNAFIERTFKNPRNKKKKVTRRFWIGVFPAIPMRIVEKEASESR